MTFVWITDPSHIGAQTAAPPRDPKWIRDSSQRPRPRDGLRGRPLRTLPQKSCIAAGRAPRRTEEVSGYWWADDRALHEAEFDRNCSLEETSGRTGESTPGDPPAQFEIEPFPQPGPRPTCPSPRGPDPSRIRAVLEALDRISNDGACIAQMDAPNERL